MSLYTLESTGKHPAPGIQDAKTLAKLGNAAAKKNPLFDSVADLRDEAIST